MGWPSNRWSQSPATLAGMGAIGLPSGLPTPSTRRGLRVETQDRLHHVTTSQRLEPEHRCNRRAGRDPDTESVTVLSVGYLVLDVIATTRMVGRSAGGTAGNVAANLAWLDYRASLLARIGDDAAGEVLQADLSNAGVDTTHIHRSPDVKTPILIQRLTESGPQYLFTCPVCHYKFASHRPATREQAERAAASAPRMLFVDRASKASLDLMGKVRAQGGIVMFEPNGPAARILQLRPSVWRISSRSARIASLRLGVSYMRRHSSRCRCEPEVVKVWIFE